MRLKARDGGGTICSVVYCSVKDWTRICYVNPDSPVHTLSHSLRIYFFPLWRADLKISGFAVEFAGCLWTVAVSQMKKLRIQKYRLDGGQNFLHILIFRLRSISNESLGMYSVSSFALSTSCLFWQAFIARIIFGSSFNRRG